MPDASSFYSLTTDVILESVDTLGFKTSGHCLTLNSLENRVYDLMLESGDHLIVKFYRPARWNAAQIQEEHDFLFELADEEIPVCAPLLIDQRSLFESGGIYFAIWPRTGGRMADEFTDTQLGELGRLIARIHNVGARKNAIHRPEVNARTYGMDSLEYLSNNNFIPQALLPSYSELVTTICDRYAQLARGVPLLRIHGDAHGGNLLRGEEGWFFLDFDDFRMGPAAQDIWLLSGQMDAEGILNRRTMIDGYRQFRDFDDSWLHLVELLRALRFIHYSAWIARRIQDPVFPQAFPHFGTEEYWLNEIQDLNQQLKTMDGSVEPMSGEAMAAEPEEELTNKDFFWDLEE